MKRAEATESTEGEDDCDFVRELPGASGGLEEATLAAIEAHLKKNEAQSIVDFDAHLDDPKLDWFVYPFPA